MKKFSEGKVISESRDFQQIGQDSYSYRLDDVVISLYGNGDILIKDKEGSVILTEEQVQSFWSLLNSKEYPIEKNPNKVVKNQE